MLSGDRLLDAMSGAEDRDILAAAQALGYLPGNRRKSVLRPLLIAAVLAALLAATAVAAGLLGRAQRLAPMPPDPSGEQRQAEIPNGFRGTPTYQGSSQWWSYMARWKDAHGSLPEDYSMEFIQGDLDRYLVCSLYRAYDREQAETLYRIAEEYGLKLYREMVYFRDDPLEFYGLTGVKPFLRGQKLKQWGGYVLEDGSFLLEGTLQIGLEKIDFDLYRYYSGSIVPFGGAMRPRTFEETEYVTARGDRVFLDIFSPRDGEITYMDPQGETFLALRSRIPQGEDPTVWCRDLAETVDFPALCLRDTEQVRRILDQKTGAEDNPEAVAAVHRFQSSPAFLGAREFQDFYRENFYGPCFTGTGGMEGCRDIDRMLESVGEKYGLVWAREKGRGNSFSRKAITFDTGAWQSWGGQGLGILHYIPKNALYTMQTNFLDAAAYRRIWPYETESGLQVVICTQGPSPFGGGYILHETEEAWILLELNGGSPQRLEAQAERLDWTWFHQ